MNVTLDVRHLPRIEGHGNIAVRVKNGKLVKASWDVVETPRFFEVMLKGKHYKAAGLLTSRICGICSISHCLTSLRASERALGVTIPPAATRLRLLAHHGELLQSHFLHLFFLAAPDFLRLPSALPLLEARPEVVQLALRLKGLANRLCDLVAGRTTHPVSLQVGGVAVAPDKGQLQAFSDELQRSLADLEEAIALVTTFEVPSFERETEFVSLKGADEYPFIGGQLVSSDGVVKDEDDYATMTNEYVTRENTSKWSKLSRESYAVGPLARVNNSFELLHSEARRVAAQLGLAPVCHNPFMAHAARLVECVHCTHAAIELIGEILTDEPGPTMAEVTPRAGAGVGAVEAPRGVLFHHYEYDDEGRITRANCVVPTTQNNANIHHDLPELVKLQLQHGVSDDELQRSCEMLVRSYDPCLSCSVH